MSVLAVMTVLAVWASPVRGDVVKPFSVGPDRFATGQHRGVDLVARPGERVRAPCSGVVTFAGPVPGHARGVTVRCGPLVATVLELAATGVRQGARAGRGSVIGRAGGDHVHLGARRAGSYVDPMSLLAPGGEDAPLPGVTRRPSPAVPVQSRHPPRAERAPPAAWLGLALLAAALPAGALLRRRERPRPLGAGPVDSLTRRWPST